MRAIVLRLTGVILFGVGVAGAAVSLLAIVDPVGTKQADDSDPFGPQGPIWQSLLSLLVFVVLTIGGARLALRRLRDSRSGGAEASTRSDGRGMEVIR